MSAAINQTGPQPTLPTPETPYILMINRDQPDPSWSTDLRHKLEENGYIAAVIHDYRENIPCEPGAVILIKASKLTILEENYCFFLIKKGYEVILTSFEIPLNGVKHWVNEIGVEDILPCFPVDPNVLFEAHDRAIKRIQEKQSPLIFAER